MLSKIKIINNWILHSKKKAKTLLEQRNQSKTNSNKSSKNNNSAPELILLQIIQMLSFLNKLWNYWWEICSKLKSWTWNCKSHKIDIVRFQFIPKQHKKNYDQKWAFPQVAALRLGVVLHLEHIQITNTTLDLAQSLISK